MVSAMTATPMPDVGERHAQQARDRVSARRSRSTGSSSEDRMIQPPIADADHGEHVAAAIDPEAVPQQR